MSNPPTPEFLEIAEKRTSSQLEASLEWMRKKADAGNPTAQDMVRWTEEILTERAKTENQPVIGADGHQYTKREYQEKQQRDSFQAGMGALRGNFASSLTFYLTGDPHLSALLGGIFEAVGGAAEGRNLNRAVSPDDSGSYDPPRVGEPSSEPSGEPEPSTDGPHSSTLGNSNLELETLTWADVQDFAEAVFAVPDSVVEAAQELTALDVPVSEATVDFLELFTVAAGEEDEEPVEDEEDEEDEDGEELAYLDDGDEDEAMSYPDDGEDELSYPDDDQVAAADERGGSGDGSDDSDDGGAAGGAVVGA